MTLAPFLASPPVTQIHALSALLALVSGTLVIVAAKGTARHLALGRLFAVAMFATAISSFWITGIWPGRYSPIHILSFVTLTTLPLAIRARRRGNIKAHASGMILNYLGLLIAGAFALSHDRVFGRMFAAIAASLSS